MKHSQINVSTRTLFGNKAKTLYRTGKVPGIIYGNIDKPLAVEFLVADFAKLYKEAGETHVVDVVVENKSYPAMIQALDIHPVTNKLRNVDFKAVDLKAKTTAFVPVELIGTAPVVKTNGGLVVIKIAELEVEALPEKLPESIKLDISKLESLDDNIFVKDIKAGNDFEILTDLELPVVVVETESVESEETADLSESNTETTESTK